MKSVLISVISAQPLPNFLLIKELRGLYSSMVFISTGEMEGRGNDSMSRSRWIERAAGLAEGSTPRVIVKEDSWLDIKQKLQDFFSDQNTSYAVNLTGGTKVMTLAVFQHFAKDGNSIYYVPFPKNEYCELFPNIHNQALSIRYRCTLSEYLAAHGLYFIYNNELCKDKKTTLNFFKRVKREQFKINEIDDIRNAHQLSSPEDKKYYSGGWFEEFVYHFIRKSFKVSEKKIALNVNLFRNLDDVEADNEYDLMFVDENTLYVIECKTSAGNSPVNARKNLDNFLYKLGAITRDFGLNVKSYVFTLTSFRDSENKIKLQVEKRMRILGVKGIFDQVSFNNPEEIIVQLKKKGHG